MMNPQHDIVMSLLETPFSRRKETEKREILQHRPVPKLDIISQEKHGNQSRTFSRTFQSSWYDSHKWLCGSIVTSKLYCWPCLLLGSFKNVWTSTGYSDLKNISRSTKIHNDSKEHIKNFMGLKRIERNASTIVDALQEHARENKILYNENVRKNRQLLAYLIDVTLLLGKQELAFRGHDESSDSVNRGNFKEVFNCMIKRNAELTEHAEKIKHIFTGQSKTVQNELISCCEEYLNEFIKNEITSSKFFSIIADDTTDITEKSQCTLTIRYVNSNGELKERFLGFHDVSDDRTANALFALLSNILEPFDFKNKLVAQCYDGASVMSGELNGLQRKIKSVAPAALFTHCAAHRLNLVLQQGSSGIPKVRIFFATILSIPAFFNQSPKRTFTLSNILKKSIPQANETRWCTRSKIVNLVNEEWDKLIIVFETIINDKTAGTESITKSHGFLKYFSDFDFAILTLIYHKIFFITDPLFKILQLKFLDINYCFSQINITVSRIKSLRDEATFNEIFECAKGRGVIPHRRGIATNKDEISTMYRILFYEILDTITCQLEVRFTDLTKLSFLSLVDCSKYGEFRKQFPQQYLTSLIKAYPNVFQKDRLLNELSNIYHDDQFLNADIQSFLRIIHAEFVDVFPEVYKLLCLILTIPATSVAAERNFSCLKRIKTYLRSTMTQERLSGLSLMSIEKNLLQELSKSPAFYDGVINKYSTSKNRRIDLVYKT